MKARHGHSAKACLDWPAYVGGLVDYKDEDLSFTGHAVQRGAQRSIDHGAMLRAASSLASPDGQPHVHAPFGRDPVTGARRIVTVYERAATVSIPIAAREVHAAIGPEGAGLNALMARHPHSRFVLRPQAVPGGSPLKPGAPHGLICDIKGARVDEAAAALLEVLRLATHGVRMQLVEGDEAAEIAIPLPLHGGHQLFTDVCSVVHAAVPDTLVQLASGEIQVHVWLAPWVRVGKGRKAKSQWGAPYDDWHRRMNSVVEAVAPLIR